MSLLVNEIFYSIQGESSYAGFPCIFIRLTGCNLRCAYCDTQYAYDTGTLMELDAIIKALAHYPCTLVEVTGGEPLLQQETPQLIAQLLVQNYRVLLETNGSLDCSPIDPRCIKIMDIKCPSSGEAAKNRIENLACLSERDEIKFVIADRDDYRFAKDMVKIIYARCPVTCIHFSPVHKKLPPATLAQWILEDGLPVRLNLQLHKLLWPHQERGV